MSQRKYLSLEEARKLNRLGRFARGRDFEPEAGDPVSRFNKLLDAMQDRIDFSWAAYNAGPARIQKLRKKAAKRGYDPNRWFNNVEHMASESIGRETVDYVANVNKYYIAYKFALERQEHRLNVRRQRSEQAELAKQEKALQAWRRSYARD